MENTGAFSLQVSSAKSCRVKVWALEMNGGGVVWKRGKGDVGSELCGYQKYNDAFFSSVRHQRLCLDVIYSLQLSYGFEVGSRDDRI